MSIVDDRRNEPSAGDIHNKLVAGDERDELVDIDLSDELLVADGRNESLTGDRCVLNFRHVALLDGVLDKLLRTVELW